MKTNVSMMKKNAQSGKKSKSVQRKKSEAAGYVTPIIGLGTVAENYLKQFVQMDGKIGEMQSDFAVSLKSGESALKSKISSENSAVSELRKSNGANIKTLRTKLTDKINKIDCNKIYEINKVQRDLEKELDAIKLEFANLNAKHKEITEEYNKLVAEIDSKNSEEMRGAEIKLCEKEEATQNSLKNIESTLEKAKNSYESEFEKQNTTLREQILDLQSKYFVNIKNGEQALAKKVSAIENKEKDDVKKETAKLTKLSAKVDKVKLAIEENKKSKNKEGVQKAKEDYKKIAAEISAVEKDVNNFIKLKKADSAEQINALKKAWEGEKGKLRTDLISAVNTLSTKLEAAKIERNFKEFKYNLDKKSLENKSELMKFVDEQNRMKTLGEICNVYNYEKGKLVLEFNEKERQKDVEEFDLETRKAVANAEAEYGKKLATIGNQFNKKEENYNFNIENKKSSFEISKASLAAQHNIELLENEFKKSNALSKIPMMKYLDENLQVNINMINDFRAERVGQFIAVCKEKVEDFLSAYEKRFEVLVKYNLQENKEMLRAVQYNYDKEAQIIKENIESAEKAGNEAFVNNLNENLNKLNAKLTEQTEFINKTHEDIVTILNNFIFAQREQAARNLELLDKFDKEIVGKYQALNDMAKKDFENSASSQEEYEKLLTDNYSSNSATLNDSYEKSVTAITEEYSSQIAEYEADRNAYTSDYEKAKKAAESEKQAVIDEYNKKREELISRITKDKADEEGKLEKEREQKETELKEIASKIKQKEKESAETEKELKSKSDKELAQAQKEYQAKIKGLAKTEKKNLTVLLKKAVIEQGKDWWEIVEE